MMAKFFFNFFLYFFAITQARCVEEKFHRSNAELSSATTVSDFFVLEELKETESVISIIKNILLFQPLLWHIFQGF